MQARGDFSRPDARTAAAYYFDPNAAAAYALRWANGYYPEYERQSNDCTNFVSQALEAGGWPIRDGIDPNDKGTGHRTCSDREDRARATSSSTTGVTGARTARSTMP